VYTEVKAVAAVRSFPHWAGQVQLRTYNKKPAPTGVGAGDCKAKKKEKLYSRRCCQEQHRRFFYFNRLCSLFFAKNASIVAKRWERSTALGVEAALIALNTYGKNFDQLAASGQMSSADVMNSTRIDNKRFTVKFASIIRLGVTWLDQNQKGWRTKFYHRQNQKGAKHPNFRKLGG
jgi:hypothetical protein